jgi:23S rRNA (uracil1939-C5)-methyltransferase
MIRKLVEGGQALGELPDGKKVFVWNALPGEVVRARLFKQKHSYAEAVAEEIVQPSPERVTPTDTNYLATSPWQIMTFEAENEYKKQIVADIFAGAKVAVPAFRLTAPGADYGYRNKTEYGFWGDESGLHLASYHRASHGKQIVSGSALTMPGIDAAAGAICKQLEKMQIRAGDLKTIIVRSSQNHELVAALYVKREDFPELVLPDELGGLRVYFSNPKSPASVRTRLLQQSGDVLLHDMLLGKSFVYDVDSFFQVNVPIYEQALTRIKQHITAPVLVDMYAGVGTIGLSAASQAVQLVELDPATAAMARQNAAASDLETEVIETSTEKALDYITSDKPVIFDPPRAGLHEKVIERVLDALPGQIAYLSCNPVTQARDLAKLQGHYNVEYFEAFNFFPRTPHIETLAILRRKHAGTID